MAEQVKYSSRIFKADQRPAYNVNGHTARVVRTGGNDHTLLFFNDELLNPGAVCEYAQEEGTIHFVLPVVGAADYLRGDFSEHIKPEELLVTNTPGSRFSLKNNNAESINYFHFALREKNFANANTLKQNVQLKAYNQPFRFQQPGSGFNGSLGVYSGRAKGAYTLSHPQNSVFTFVINGAFEVEDKLMEHRDGLLTWNAPVIEYEALSEFAILLIIEIPPHLKTIKTT